MCSSSTASTTAPRAAARSVSRMRAAPSSAAAAARSERSRCPATCWWIVTNSPAPSSTRTSVSTPAYHAVSWRRSRARGCITGLSSSEPVTRAAQRGDQLGLEPIVDLSTQPPDQDVQEVGEGIVVVVPHMCGDGSAVEHHHVEAPASGTLATLRPGRRKRRIDPLRAQAVAQQARQLGVVFDDQDTHGFRVETTYYYIW